MQRSIDVAAAIPGLAVLRLHGSTSRCYNTMEDPQAAIRIVVNNIINNNNVYKKIRGQETPIQTPPMHVFGKTNCSTKQ
jgi:hypothetical protein